MSCMCAATLPFNKEDIYFKIAGRPTNQTQLNKIHQNSTQQHAQNQVKQYKLISTKQHISKLN